MQSQASPHYRCHTLVSGSKKGQALQSSLLVLVLSVSAAI